MTRIRVAAVMTFDQTVYDETCVQIYNCTQCPINFRDCRESAIAKSEANFGAPKWALESYCVGEIGSRKRIYSCICKLWPFQFCCEL
jgi:hypothetical protein